MQQTPNLNLNKPEGTDVVNIDDLNANADILDGKLGSSGHSHDGTAGNGPKITAAGLADGAATDTVIGTRTITDTVAAASGAGLLTNLLSKIGYMIKNITGKSNWYTLPAITLETISNLFGISGHSHNGVAGQGPKIAYSNITGTPSSLPANGGTAAACSGNAATATKLATARTIALSGDVTGSGSFDGSADLNIETTLSSGSGSIITGDVAYYVNASISASGDGLSWDTAFKTINEAVSALQNKVFLGNVDIYVKAGTYDESIILEDLMITGILVFHSCDGEVTLTGATLISDLISSNAYTCTCYINTTTRVYFDYYNTGYNWSIQPSAASVANYAGLLVINGSTVFVRKMTVDPTNVTVSSAKVGTICIMLSNLYIGTCTAYSCSIAMRVTSTSKAYVGEIAGDGNQVLLGADNGAHLSYAINSATNTTTEYSKSSGGIITYGAGLFR